MSGFQNIDKNASQERVNALANKLNDIIIADNKAGTVNQEESCLAALHLAAMILSLNVDPDQRALGTARVLASFPELVRKYSIAHQTPDIRCPAGQA